MTWFERGLLIFIGVLCVAAVTVAILCAPSGPPIRQAAAPAPQEPVLELIAQQDDGWARTWRIYRFRPTGECVLYVSAAGGRGGLTTIRCP